MVKLSDAGKALKIAEELVAAGLQVFPARYRDKNPLVDWKKYQTIDARPMVTQWFKNRGNLNFWVMTGRQSGYIVIDCDSPEGEAWWRERIGDLMDATTCVKTSKGHHYWFKIPDDWDMKEKIPTWPCHPKKDDTFKESFDVRADGSGVIVPPSIHETGLQYTWVRPLDEALPAPPGLMDGTYRAQAPQPTGDAESTTTGTGGTTRSLLSRLLVSPPGGEGSGRNDWLARVAGHYAKTYHNQQDLYLTHCAQANASMGTPLDEAEYDKTVNSIWQGEHERNDHRAIDATCGFLVSGGTNIQTQVVIRNGDEKTYMFVEYADFDLVAKGVMTDEAGRRTYWAEIVRPSRADPDKTDKLDIVLRAEVLGDDRALRKFLAGYACIIVPPDNMYPKVGSPGQRIQRYLESQQPPVVEITPALGYHPDALGEGNGAFITHEGAISANGTHSIAEVAVRADPRLRSGGTAPFEYGFGDNPEIARQILAEVLTFHDDSVTSVFGAWWAACLLKPIIEERTSLFPFMAVEAPSEAGKTNGFFAMLLQLIGNTRGETQPTKAALRDMAAANRNGCVWVDDLDDPAYLMELLRAATSGGSLTKMGEDRESVKNTQIVAPIVISGEALGLGTQKALVDRAIVLKAPSPTGRRSLHDSSRPQWDDVLEVREQYPNGLHVLAGWYVQDALNVVPEVLAALRAGRTGGSGRATDKVAVLRAGARLLDYLLRQDGAWDGHGVHARRMETWLGQHLVDETGTPITSNENALTLELVPWALRKWQFADKATQGEHGNIDTPVFVKGLNYEEIEEAAIPAEGLKIGFNVDLLAEAWETQKHGRQEKRTTTGPALRDQAMALGFKSKRVKVSGSGGRLLYYFSIEGELAAAIVRRAVGM